MTELPPRRPRSGRGTIGLVLAGLLGLVATGARSQDGASARQVTVFGIVATPNSNAIDPKLKSIAPQLRGLLPNHGFRLLDVQSKRLVAGQAVTCNLGAGGAAATTLMVPLDGNGKVQLRCELLQDQSPVFATVVATPPNQLFFCDRQNPDGSRLLIGIGAR